MCRVANIRAKHIMSIRFVFSTSPDVAWETLAQMDPYYAVSTSHSSERADFFRSGERHVDDLLGRIHRLCAPGFAPRRILDFGCGVGRMLIPFARMADEVIGTDVAPSMITEAARNCAELPNVRLESNLGNVAGQFDLIHSYNVFQHIPVRRGMRLIAQLVGMLSTEGVMALHVTYKRHAPFYRKLIHRARVSIPGVNAAANIVQGLYAGTPMMQMNHYDVAAICGMVNGTCVRAYETDHRGHLGTMLLLARHDRQRK